MVTICEIRDIGINQDDSLNQVNINLVFSIQRAPNSLESVQVTFDGVGAGSTTSNGAY